MLRWFACNGVCANLLMVLIIVAGVMTMTDLDIHHLKRSVNDVHYVYVFHSLVSTHRAYRTRAFDAYDSILCSGPHHFAELTEVAKMRDIRPQKLYKSGYCRLDDFFSQSEQNAPPLKMI